ncbi:hypothetical protein ACQPVP_15115 [Clostridium nigeriense]|uniref:hypothetical protein n=1 Tax=Clostridium nigeriense TaxID=1805470 RepID=UPI003D34749A
MLECESNILSKFFMKDLTKLIQKYNNINKETIEKLEILVERVDNKEIKSILMSNLDVTINLIDELGGEIDSNVIQLYFFIKDNIKEINIIEAKSIYEEIEYRGYSKFDDIIMYSKLQDLREYVSDEIDGILSSPYEIDRLFDKDTIIDYFLEGITIEEVAREIVTNYDEYEEVLGIEPEVMFTSEDGQEYYYAHINN